MRSEVYRNLRNNTFSVRRGGLVVDHVRTFRMMDVDFRVQPAGRDKVRRTGQKNVHAYLSGELISPPFPFIHDVEFRVLAYDPRVHDTFVDDILGTPVTSAEFVIGMIGSGVYYSK